MITDTNITDQDIDNYRKDRQALHYFVESIKSLSATAKHYEELGDEAFNRAVLIVFMDAFVKSTYEKSSKTTQF